MDNEFFYKRNFTPPPRYEGVLNYIPKQYDFIVISGSCSVESDYQIKTVAEFVAKQGATHLRGGVFRAGTFLPKKFGYVEKDLLKSYRDAARANGLKNIIEVLDYTDESLDLALEYSTCLQVGARQMQNYTLLKKLSVIDRQVFLKRNTGSNLDEFLGACEYLISGGCCEPVLIERGSSTHMNHVRWDLSVSTIAAVKQMTHVPIIVDASHGSGRRDLVSQLTLAGIAAGADGCLIETHYSPKDSLSDADQAIDFYTYEKLMNKIKELRKVL